MPSETDLYFPVTDARYEAQFIPHCSLLPIPSLWGHPAGAGASPADLKFLNEHIGEFLNRILVAGHSSVSLRAVPHPSVTASEVQLKKVCNKSRRFESYKENVACADLHAHV